MRNGLLALCTSAVVLGALCVGCAGADRRADGVSVFTATAQGLPSASATTDAQKRFTALESAKQRALSKLAEEIYGVQLVRVSKVRDLQFAGEEVEAKVSGELKGVEVVRIAYDEESAIAEVTVRVGLDARGNVVPGRQLPLVAPPR